MKHQESSTASRFSAKTLVALAVLGAATVMGPRAAVATPYFRLIDFNHPIVGAGMNFAVKDFGETSGTTDIALVTHSVKDGTIIPESLRPYFPPVAWTPCQLGLGGSLSKNAVATFGTSGNLSPTVAAVLFRAVDESSAPILRTIKKALEGSSKGEIRLGFVFQGNVVKDGTFQSFKQMFPGEGIADIAYTALRINAGGAWKF